MTQNRICITTDCVCDLPDEMIRNNNVDIIYFYVETDSGRFRDVDEITAQNIFDYLKNGGSKVITAPASVEDTESFFAEKLLEYDSMIHIAVSSKLSKFVDNALQAAKNLGDDGKRIHIVDSRQISTSIGHMVLRAAQMVKDGSSCEQIIAEMEAMRDKLSTSFMADSADFLYRNGKVTKKVQQLCSFFRIHPVLSMKNGCLKLSSCYMGNYEQCMRLYIRRELKKHKNIDTKRLFITHASCTAKDIKSAKKEIDRIISFDEVIVTNASATISGNSGPRTLGLFFIKEQ